MLAKKITSLQHPLVEHWLRLRLEKSYREETQRVLISGKKMIEELPVQRLITLAPHPEIGCKDQILVTEPILKKITDLPSPDGFAAEVFLPPEQDLKKRRRLLILDQIQDPGNLGTLARTALGLSWEGVILTDGCVDFFNDKALRAGRGAQFHLPYRRMSEEEIASFGLFLYTADLKGTPLEDLQTKEPLGLILSHEGRGVQSWSSSIAKKITIPMSSLVDSLNVAASGAILMYQMRKR